MLKKTRIYAVIGIFLISFIVHYAFALFPNILLSIFFPVNESIWEHMKIIFTSTIIYSFIDKYILDKKNVLYNNFNLQLLISSTLSIVLYLLIYIPIYKLVGENLIISISLLLIVYIIMQYVSYRVMLIKEINIPTYIVIIVVILIYMVFTYLTYNPPHNYLFYDNSKNDYGVISFIFS